MADKKPLPFHAYDDIAAHVVALLDHEELMSNAFCYLRNAMRNDPQFAERLVAEYGMPLTAESC